MPKQLRRATLALAMTAATVVPASTAHADTLPSAKMSVDVNVTRFVYDKTGVTALGTASGAVGDQGTRRKVTLSVARTSSCSILSLQLQDLRLQLLGLDLDASTINLHITGKNDRTLGRLFCRLSKALKLAKASVARRATASLNRHLAGRPMQTVGVRSTVYATTAQAGAPTCQVLDLVVGPLHLDLLGLVVDLYGPDRTKPVEVVVTADPSKGVLGSTFCRLANQ